MCINSEQQPQANVREGPHRSEAFTAGLIPRVLARTLYQGPFKVKYDVIGESFNDTKYDANHNDQRNVVYYVSSRNQVYEVDPNRVFNHPDVIINGVTQAEKVTDLKGGALNGYKAILDVMIEHKNTLVPSPFVVFHKDVDKDINISKFYGYLTINDESLVEPICKLWDSFMKNISKFLKKSQLPDDEYLFNQEPRLIGSAEYVDVINGLALQVNPKLDGTIENKAVLDGSPFGFTVEFPTDLDDIPTEFIMERFFNEVFLPALKIYYQQQEV
ncbi:MAG: hypothetical protein WCJ58_08180 [bacterium]